MKLNLRNYQAGIDLGTTNSAVSILDQNGAKILDIEGGNNLLPSCVYFHPEHGCMTGTEAKNLWANETGDTNGHKSFKKKMGREIPFPIHSLSTTLLAEELSGIVLKKLQEIYKREIGEDLHTVIVTVPARFDIKAVDATRVAAMGNYKANGTTRVQYKKQSEYYGSFLQVETLMEPIAASLAYGMKDNVDKNGSWLVFDFGGGTFDAAIVNYQEGHMDVKFHAGDNQLGGDNLDSKMLHYLIDRLSKSYDLKNFETSKKFKTIVNKLLYEIEKIKITLSTENEAVLITPPGFRDNKNREVKEEIVITRDDYNREVGPILQRSIDICLQLFKDNQIAPSDLDRVLLVGGPTQYPYFREMIKNQLKIEVDTSIDPMTAVATGAAIYGSTRDIPEDVKPEIIDILSQTPTDCRVEINCENKTLHKSEIVTGTIIVPDGNLDMIDSISISRSDKGWESGNLKINDDGTFDVEVHLREKQANFFHVQVNGKGGKNFTVTSNEFSILHGIAGTTDHAPYSLNITIKGQKCVVIIPKDAEYPAQGFNTFYTTREISKDDEDDQGILFVEITEGESEDAGNNIFIGQLKIPNDELSRNLPIDTQLEVSVYSKSDRTITASCTIPIARQTFEAEIIVDRTKEGKQQFIDDFRSFKNDFETIKTNTKNLEDSEWPQKLDDLSLDKAIEEIETIVSEEIEGDEKEEIFLADSLMKARNMLTDAKLKLERFEGEYIFDYTRYKLGNLRENITETDGKVADKIVEWDEQLDAYEEEASVEKVNSINSEMYKYDKTHMGTVFLIHVIGFSWTKQDFFAEYLNELKSVATKAGNYEAVNEIVVASTDWNVEINDENNNVVILGKYYRKLGYTLQGIIDNLEEEEIFTINDFDKIGHILNNAEFIFEPAIIEKIAKIKNASRKLLQKGIEFSKAYTSGKLDKMNVLLEEFKDMYMISDDNRKILTARSQGASEDAVIDTN